jgi:hAT family C-terminal dimerisation region
VNLFPNLASAAASLFGIPVTLGGPGTMFQAFKDFYRFKSNGCSAEMVEKLMYLKHNAHLTS